MYVPPAFRINRADFLAFADARGFGLVCVTDGERPIASSVPFHLEYESDGTPLLWFHLARNNHLINLADGVRPWLFTIAGPDAYVSPDWYVSADQVPTWLYQTVHMTGPVRTMSNNQMVDHLNQLSAKFENELAPKPPWLVDKMSTGRLESMKKAIVGLVMTIDDIEGQFKLNQHKSEADYVGVTNALALQKSAGAHEISSMMRAMRPHAFATIENDSSMTHEGNQP